MNLVTFGEHSKLTVKPTERQQIRKFYCEVLGCAQTKKSEPVDCFQIGPTFYLGVVYDVDALSMEDRMKSIWLELRTPQLEKLKQAILDCGVKELKYWDEEHFYFQAPGGQIFRLIDEAEDMSGWR